MVAFQPMLAGTWSTVATACVVLGLIGYLVILPLIVGGIITQKRGVKRLSMDRESAALPAFAADYFNAVETELAPLGFVYEAAMADVELTMKRTSSYCAFYSNRSKRECARVLAVRCEAGEGAPIVTQLIDFVSEYDDGTILSVDNSTSPALFAVPPYRCGEHLSGVTDVATLYRGFSAVKSQYGLPPKPVPAAQHLVPLFDQECERDFDWFVQAGQLRDVGDGNMKLTLLCRLLRVPGLLPPFSTWRAGSMRRRARRLLRRLGVSADNP